MSYAQRCLKAGADLYAAVLRITLLGVAVIATVASYGAANAQTLISGLSPNPDGGDPDAVTACNGAPQIGIVYRNSEAEPHIAVNPLNTANMIAGWHQDRWSTGAALTAA